MTLCNAVGKASGHLAGAGAVGEVVERIGIAESYVGELALFVGHPHFHYACAERAQHNLSSLVVGKSDKGNFACVTVKIFYFNGFHSILRRCFSHAQAARRVSSRSRSAFQPNTLLATEVSAHTAGTSPGRRPTIL